MIGASGAIAGVMGAYALLYPHGKVLTLVPMGFYTRFVDLPAWVFMGFWILMQVYSGSVAVLAGAAGFGGVAWWAHVGGFVGGIVLLALLRPSRSARTLHWRSY
jgi:membrane associated rhomboid family serine protease